MEYSEEFTFDAGTICNMHIGGDGWIDCRKEDDRISISGIFGLAREGDWKNKGILPEDEYLKCWYDPAKKCGHVILTYSKRSTAPEIIRRCMLVFTIC